MSVTVEGMIIFISTIPIFMIAYYVQKISALYDTPAFRFLQISWILLGLNMLFMSIAVQFHIPWFYVSRLAFLAASTLFLDYGLSLLEFERIRSFKFGVSTSLSSLLMFSSLTTISYTTRVLPNGQMTYKLQGTTFMLFVVLSFWILILYIDFFYRIYQGATAKQNTIVARRLVIITIVGGIVVIFSFMLHINLYLPGIDTICFSATMYLLYLNIKKNPRLMFYNFDPPQKLIIMEIDSGNKIFDYDWTDNKIQIPSQLFATALESIHIFIKESLNHGKLKEISLDDGVLLIQHDEEENITFALLVSSTSYVIRKNFDRFIRKFKDSRIGYTKERNVVIVDDDTAFIDLVEDSF